MENSEVKPGIKTSEFWVTVSMVVGLLTTAAGSEDAAVRLAAVIGACVVGCVLGLAYIFQRRAIKVEALQEPWLRAGVEKLMRGTEQPSTGSRGPE